MLFMVREIFGKKKSSLIGRSLQVLFAIIVYLIAHKNRYFRIIFDSLFICFVCLVFLDKDVKEELRLLENHNCVIVICRILRRLSSTYLFIYKLKETHRKLKEIA